MDQQMISNIAETLHAVFCPLNHEDEIFATVEDKSGMCNWYVERQCENTWNELYHQEWLIQARLLIANLKEDGKNEAEVENFLTITLKLCRILLDLKRESSNGEQMILGLLGEYLKSRTINT